MFSQLPLSIKKNKRANASNESKTIHDKIVYTQQLLETKNDITFYHETAKLQLQKQLNLINSINYKMETSKLKSKWDTFYKEQKKNKNEIIKKANNNKELIKKNDNQLKIKKCEICGKQNLIGHQYYNHKRIHKNKISCSICSKVFARTDILQTHIKVVHENKKIKIKCKLCKKKYEHNYLYRVHQNKCKIKHNKLQIEKKNKKKKRITKNY